MRKEMILASCRLASTGEGIGVVSTPRNRRGFVTSVDQNPRNENASPAEPERRFLSFGGERLGKYSLHTEVQEISAKNLEKSLFPDSSLPSHSGTTSRFSSRE